MTERDNQEPVLDLPENIAKQFGVSQDIAMRVLALATKNIFLTQGLMHVMAGHPGIQRFIMSDALIGDESDLDAGAIAALLRTLGLHRIPVICMERGGKRLLHVAEHDAAVLPGKNQESLLSFALTEPDDALSRSTAAAFSREKLAALELVIFTSTDATEKIEAVRQIALAPISKTDRGRMVLKALSDESPRVRAEAATSLKHLGLYAEVADALRNLAIGDAGRKQHALGVLKQWIPRGNESELGSILIALISGLDDPAIQAIKKEFLEVFREVCLYVAERPEHLRELANRLFQQLVVSGTELFPVVRDIFLKLAEHSMQQVENILWDKLALEEEMHLKRFLLLTLGHLQLNDASWEHVVEEILDIADNDSYVLFESVLACHADKSAGIMVEKLARTTVRNQMACVKLLERLCHRPVVGPDTRSRAAQVMLDVARTSTGALRSAALGSTVVDSETIDPDVRRRFAQELLDSMHQVSIQSDFENIAAAIGSLGWPAIDPLLSFLENTVNTYKLRSFGVHAMAVLVDDGLYRSRRSDASVRENVKRCVGDIRKSDDMDRGLFVQVLGMLCSLPAVHKKVLEKHADALLNRTWRVDHNYHLIRALQWMVLNPKLTTDRRERIARLFVGLLSQEFPDVEVSGETTRDGTLYQLGGEVDAHIVMIPGLIQGLRNVMKTELANARLHAIVIHGLIHKWRRVANWREVWSPLNIGYLIEAMSEIARYDEISEALRIAMIKELFQHFEKFGMGAVPVMDALGDVLYQLDMPQMDDMACAVVRRLITLWKKQDQYTQTEKGTILRVLARIASRGYLDRANQKPDNYRQSILRLLYQGLHEGIPWTYASLQSLADCPHLAAGQREEIHVRLRKYSQLGFLQGNTR